MPHYQLIPTSAMPHPVSPAPPPPLPSGTSWQPNAYTTTNSSTAPPTWLLDSGASHHITADLSNLSMHTPYDGPDDIVIGDGSGLHIIDTSSVFLPTPSQTFHLHDVLVVPKIKRNHISIYLNFAIQFSSDSFFVRDLRTGATFLRGKAKGGVYEWPSISLLTSFSTLTGVESQFIDWHHRLGHPSESVQSFIISSFHLSTDSPHLVSAIVLLVIVIKVINCHSRNLPLRLHLPFKSFLLMFGLHHCILLMTINIM